MSPSPPRRWTAAALLRRMAIGGAAVWATPMMHSVASAQAAASCGPGILDWDTFTTGSTFTNTIIGNTTITLGIAGVTPANTAVTADNAPDLQRQRGRHPRQEPPVRDEARPTARAANGNRQTITFAFSNPVTNVAFTLMDIDNLDRRRLGRSSRDDHTRLHVHSSAHDGRHPCHRQRHQHRHPQHHGSLPEPATPTTTSATPPTRATSPSATRARSRRSRSSTATR